MPFSSYDAHALRLLWHAHAEAMASLQKLGRPFSESEKAKLSKRSSRIFRGPMTPGCESRLPCTRLRFAEFDCLPTDHEFLITRHCSNKATLPILDFAARRLARHQHGGR